MRQPSTTGGQHRFAEVSAGEIQRSKFARPSGLKTTLDAGFLVPVFVDEALPGDVFNMKPTMFGRLATPIHPVMDNLFMDTFWFAVPVRLLWENWEKFNGAQTDPADSTDFLVPQMISDDPGGFAEGSLADYFGMPTKVPAMSVNSLWHRAYNLIYNEWFRDENLQDSLVVDTDDGPDDEADYAIVRRGKRHDYFTSCLPFAQKADPVSLPLGTVAPVVSVGDGEPTFDADDAVGSKIQVDTGGGVLNMITDPSSDGTLKWNDSKLETDLSLATAATINQLREAFQLQRLFERDARGGTRYTEILKSHFGVSSPDQRLQRPEFLGGGTTRLMVNQVAQTSETAATPLAELAAFSTVTAHGGGFVASFVEHCVIIGMVSIRADLNYQQGLDRMFSRRTRFDFYWPAFAHLGEQTVLNQELFAQGSADAPADAAAFGFQERYAEYRYKQSKVTGQMRSNAATPLDTWHLAQNFAALPALAAGFIQEFPPIDRIIAVPSEPNMLLDCYFDLQCARPMPVNSVPGLIDHF